MSAAAPQTLSHVIELWSERFANAPLAFGHGTDNPWDEAVWMVLHLTGLPDRQDAMDAVLSAQQLAEIRRIGSARIERRIPLAYLLGEARFAGLSFEIEPGVIVPRSPIAELLLDQLQPWLLNEPKRILDMCTGSGCIGIAAAINFPNSQVLLVDTDPAAVALAQRNIDRHNVADRVQVLQSDLFKQVQVSAPDDAKDDGKFDLVLCNPPYVSTADMAQLPPEFQAEPALALAAGDDGLDLVRRLLSEMPQHLTAQGLLVLEVGRSAPALAREFPRLPFIWPELSQGGEGLVILDGGSFC